jgi:hypothetical protein
MALFLLNIIYVLLFIQFNGTWNWWSWWLVLWFRDEFEPYRDLTEKLKFSSFNQGESDVTVLIQVQLNQGQGSLTNEIVT